MCKNCERVYLDSSEKEQIKTLINDLQVVINDSKKILEAEENDSLRGCQIADLQWYIREKSAVKSDIYTDMMSERDLIFS